MSTIIDRINSINQGVQDVKADFKTVLENKGVEVADTLKLKDYPNLINEIKGSVTENIDLTNLTPENIRAGVTINGVTGTLVEQWDVVISPNRPENPRNGTIWIRDLSDESNNESGDDSGGGGSDGGTSNADYIVSGAVSVPEANGEYVEDGTLNDRPKYVNTSNSNAIIRFDAMVGWSVFYMGQPKYTTMDTTSATPPVSATWKYGSETVTVVKGNSSGGNESSTPADYIVSGAGTEAVNGNYYNTGETRGNYPVYANSNGVKLWFFNLMGGWVFSPDSVSESTAVWYYHCEAYGDVTTGNWANDALYPSVDALGAAPLPTVTKA